MSEETKKYLLDIRECVQFIQEQTAGMKTFGQLDKRLSNP